MEEFLNIAREVFQEIKRKISHDIKYFDQDKERTFLKFWQMISMLEKGGHFEGINRKIQLRPLKY